METSKPLQKGSGSVSTALPGQKLAILPRTKSYFATHSIPKVPGTSLRTHVSTCVCAPMEDCGPGNSSATVAG